MADNKAPQKGGGRSEFEREASQAQPGLVGEFIDYLRQNKKWWITPIVAVLLLMGLLILLSGTSVAPFIYTIW